MEGLSPPDRLHPLDSLRNPVYAPQTRGRSPDYEFSIPDTWVLLEAPAQLLHHPVDSRTPLGGECWLRFLPTSIPGLSWLWKACTRPGDRKRQLWVALTSQRTQPRPFGKCRQFPRTGDGIFKYVRHGLSNKAEYGTSETMVELIWLLSSSCSTAILPGGLRATISSAFVTELEKAENKNGRLSPSDWDLSSSSHLPDFLECSQFRMRVSSLSNI